MAILQAWTSLMLERTGTASRVDRYLTTDIVNGTVSASDVIKRSTGHTRTSNLLRFGGLGSGLTRAPTVLELNVIHDISSAPAVLFPTTSLGHRAALLKAGAKCTSPSVISSGSPCRL